MRTTKELNTKNKIPKANNGITLIALVITIIVMMILVAVTITMAVNGGLFGYATKAGQETNRVVAEEQEWGAGSVIEQYLYGITKDVASLPEYSEDLMDETTKLLTTNAKYISGNQVAVVPKGFKVVPGLNGTTTIADGLVITDQVDSSGNSIGNEFVWIPVTYTARNTDTNPENGYDDGFDLVFYRSDWSDNARGTTKYTETTGSSYNEPLSPGGYTNEVAEYNDMVQSVYKNGGFYIGRFEAGTTVERTLYPVNSTSPYASNNNQISDEERTSPLVVKRGAYPYNYVGWGADIDDYTSNVLYTSGSKNYDQGKGALYLSKQMYYGKDVGVTSTLCYGIQWDAMMDFVKDDDHNVTRDYSWGNYNDIGFSCTGKYFANGAGWSSITPTNKPKGVSRLLTTGASETNQAKNIYDVAGNCFEWTNEAYSSSVRVRRGGSFADSLYYFPASSRDGLRPTYSEYNASFRPVLYITNNA